VTRSRGDKVSSTILTLRRSLPRPSPGPERILEATVQLYRPGRRGVESRPPAPRPWSSTRTRAAAPRLHQPRRERPRRLDGPAGRDRDRAESDGSAARVQSATPTRMPAEDRDRLFPYVSTKKEGGGLGWHRQRIVTETAARYASRTTRRANSYPGVPAPRAPPGGSVEVRHAGETIMVVDDERSILLALKGSSRQGYVRARRGARRRELSASSGRPRLLDIWLPAVTASRSCRGQQGWPDLPSS